MTKNNTTPEKEAIKLTNFWQVHGPNSYPLDIASLIDGAIHSSSFKGELQTRFHDFDQFEGCLVRTQDSDKWTILINDNIANKRRQRFTYAHELGHFMCHRHLQDRFEDTEENLNNFRETIETEANVFASWLLMPNNLLRNEFSHNKWHTDTLCNIGNRFECSLQASALRYVKLSKEPMAFVVSRDGTIIWACKSATAPYMSSYCFGNELPEKSHAKESYTNNLTCTEQQDVGYAWSKLHQAKESQYFDISGNGYQYTCIEFEK